MDEFSKVRRWIVVVSVASLGLGTGCPSDGSGGGEQLQIADAGDAGQRSTDGGTSNGGPLFEGGGDLENQGPCSVIEPDSWRDVVREKVLRRAYRDVVESYRDKEGTAGAETFHSSEGRLSEVRIDS
ncbi:MAG: hypothetical protein ABEN55_06165, partial [Bradymonadaceae bacterium]